MTFTLEQALRSCRDVVMDCDACGVIDIPSGRLVGVVGASALEHRIGLIAIAAAELFDPQNISVSTLMELAGAGELAAQRSPDELMLEAEGLVHIFIRHPESSRVVVFTSEASSSVALALTQARAAVQDLNLTQYIQ